MSWKRVAGLGAAALGGIAVHDLVQTKHALTRNFPVLAHARYLLEKLGPELRQYIVTSNDEERPFSRDQRSWVYASAKGQNNYSGFGTDNDVEHLPGYAIIRHRTFADSLPHAHAATTGLPSAKVLGGPRGRTHAFRPPSLVNVSAMSYGSLSGPAIESINAGARDADCLHNTGEGGISPYHLQGGDLMMQIGTAYFGCRDEEGRFDLAKLKESIEGRPVRALEIKLSQGAKPGMGGLLPAAKVTEEIAAIRGIPMGRDCASPGRHTAFDDVDSMLDFVEMLAAETGLPVGIKSAVGEMTFWQELVRLMGRGDRGVDFVTVDGGEGGTGAAPAVFADSIALPFRWGFGQVYSEFARAGLTEDLTFIGSGKTGLPQNAIVAMALGADMVNVAREPMMAVGCIQAQRCHTGHCPTGVATQNPRYTRGLVPADKGPRMANYVTTFRKELVKVTEAVGVAHPGLITPEDIAVMDGDHSSRSLREVYGYQQGWGTLGPDLAEEVTRLMAPLGREPEQPSIEEGEGHKETTGFSPH